MKLLSKLSILGLILCLCAGCDRGWQLDYGDTDAQFNEDAVLEKAKPYLAKPIIVKGVVTKQDLTDPENCRIFLGHSICCNLGDARSLAESYGVGKTVFIKGILKRCEEGDILLEPAGGRDPKAEFNPIK